MARKPAKPSEAKPPVDELKDIRDRFEKIADLWKKDRERYKADIKFLAGEHWPAATKHQRDGDERLSLVIDKLSQYQHQVVNDSRQNRPQIKVRPVDSNADIETAEIYDGLVRHIQERSNADTAYDIALECATGGGFGFIRIIHEYAHENTFDQELAIKPIPNPLQVYFGQHKEPDGSDCTECFIVEDVPEDEFKEEYPGVDPKSWDDAGNKYGDWFAGEKVRVAERYWMTKQKRPMLLLETGEVISEEDYQLAVENKLPVPAVKTRRTLPVNVVKWAKLCGSQYLEPEREEIWKWIPVVPVWGNTQNIDGEVRHISMIHNAKDAQLLYDYSRSAFAERVGQTPEAPWVAAAGQIENHRDEWDGSKRVRVQTYDPVDINNTPIPAPARQSPSDIPAGFAQDMQLSEHDIQGALGMYQASLGRQGNATSGVQEQEQARKGDVSTFHYHDNLTRALRHAGRILVFAIPKVYDSARVVRILGLDGSADMIHIDPRQQQASQKVGAKTVYNLGAGTYDVAVQTGPSYQTRRQEAAAMMSQVMTSDPALMGMYADLFFASQDWPMAQEFSKRAKLLLPPAIQQAEAKEGEQSPEVQAANAQAQQAIQQRDQFMQQAQGEFQKMGQELATLKQEKASKEGELRIKDAETKLKEKELEIKQYEAETKRLQGNGDGVDVFKAKLAAATSVTVANISAKAQKDAADVAADQAADAQFTNDMGGSVPPDEAEGAVVTAKPKPKRPLDALMAAHAESQARMDKLEQMHAQLHQAVMAPRKKTAIATKQPDGSFRLESVETLQ